MKSIKAFGVMAGVAMITGCTSMNGVQGPKGPKLVGSGYSTESGQYAEIGVEFSSVGDFFSFVSPSRWKSPLATGGSLSWINPGAWSEDAGRTGRILIGEAVVVGGVALAASGGGGGSSDGGTSGDTGISGPGSPPAPPPPVPE